MKTMKCKNHCNSTNILVSKGVGQQKKQLIYCSEFPDQKVMNIWIVMNRKGEANREALFI